MMTDITSFGTIFPADKNQLLGQPCPGKGDQGLSSVHPTLVLDACLPHCILTCVYCAVWTSPSRKDDITVFI